MSPVPTFRSITPRILLLACALGLAGCGKDTLEISDPWIPLAPPNVKVLAGYVVFENHTDVDLKLISASSSLFETVELHRTEHDGDLARMVAQPNLQISAGERIAFEPGSYHLMLIGPRLAFTEGMQVPINLVFSNGPSKTVDFAVKPSHFRL